MFDFCSGFECQYADQCPCPHSVILGMNDLLGSDSDICLCGDCQFNTNQCEDCFHYPFDCDRWRDRV